MSPLVRVVKMTFQKDKIPEFLALFEKTRIQIRNFPGCQHLQLLEEHGGTGVMMTYSHWDSEEALNNYRDSELFGEVWAQTKPLFSEKPMAWSLDQRYKMP